MKKRIIGVLIVFLLALSSFALAESSDCGFFCQIGEWWNDFRGENVAGKAGFTVTENKESGIYIDAQGKMYLNPKDTNDYFPLNPLTGTVGSVAVSPSNPLNVGEINSGGTFMPYNRALAPIQRQSVGLLQGVSLAKKEAFGSLANKPITDAAVTGTLERLGYVGESAVAQFRAEHKLLAGETLTTQDVAKITALTQLLQDKWAKAPLDTSGDKVVLGAGDLKLKDGQYYTTIGSINYAVDPVTNVLIPVASIPGDAVVAAHVQDGVVYDLSPTISGPDLITINQVQQYAASGKESGAPVLVEIGDVEPLAARGPSVPLQVGTTVKGYVRADTDGKYTDKTVYDAEGKVIGLLGNENTLQLYKTPLDIPLPEVMAVNIDIKRAITEAYLEKGVAAGGMSIVLPDQSDAGTLYVEFGSGTDPRSVEFPKAQVDAYMRLYQKDKKAAFDALVKESEKKYRGFFPEATKLPEGKPKVWRETVGVTSSWRLHCGPWGCTVGDASKLEDATYITTPVENIWGTLSDTDRAAFVDQMKKWGYGFGEGYDTLEAGQTKTTEHRLTKIPSVRADTTKEEREKYRTELGLPPIDGKAEAARKAAETALTKLDLIRDGFDKGALSTALSDNTVTITEETITDTRMTIVKKNGMPVLTLDATNLRAGILDNTIVLKNEQGTVLLGKDGIPISIEGFGGNFETMAGAGVSWETMQALGKETGIAAVVFEPAANGLAAKTLIYDVPLSEEGGTSRAKVIKKAESSGVTSFQEFTFDLPTSGVLRVVDVWSEENIPVRFEVKDKMVEWRGATFTNKNIGVLNFLPGRAGSSSLNKHLVSELATQNFISADKQGRLSSGLRLGVIGDLKNPFGSASMTEVGQAVKAYTDVMEVGYNQLSPDQKEDLFGNTEANYNTIKEKYRSTGVSATKPDIDPVSGNVFWGGQQYYYDPATDNLIQQRRGVLGIDLLAKDLNIAPDALTNQQIQDGAVGIYQKLQVGEAFTPEEVKALKEKPLVVLAGGVYLNPDLDVEGKTDAQIAFGEVDPFVHVNPADQVAHWAELGGYSSTDDFLRNVVVTRDGKNVDVTSADDIKSGDFVTIPQATPETVTEGTRTWVKLPDGRYKYTADAASDSIKGQDYLIATKSGSTLTVAEKGGALSADGNIVVATTTYNVASEAKAVLPPPGAWEDKANGRRISDVVAKTVDVATTRLKNKDLGIKEVGLPLTVDHGGKLLHLGWNTAQKRWDYFTGVPDAKGEGTGRRQTISDNTKEKVTWKSWEVPKPFVLGKGDTLGTIKTEVGKREGEWIAVSGKDIQYKFEKGELYAKKLSESVASEVYHKEVWIRPGDSSKFDTAERTHGKEIATLSYGYISAPVQVGEILVTEGDTAVRFRKVRGNDNKLIYVSTTYFDTILTEEQFNKRVQGKPTVVLTEANKGKGTVAEALAIEGSVAYVPAAGGATTAADLVPAETPPAEPAAAVPVVPAAKVPVAPLPLPTTVTINSLTKDSIIKFKDEDGKEVEFKPGQRLTVEDTEGLDSDTQLEFDYVQRDDGTAVVKKYDYATRSWVDSTPQEVRDAFQKAGPDAGDNEADTVIIIEGKTSKKYEVDAENVAVTVPSSSNRVITLREAGDGKIYAAEGTSGTGALTTGGSEFTVGNKGKVDLVYLNRVLVGTVDAGGNIKVDPASPVAPELANAVLERVRARRTAVVPPPAPPVAGGEAPAPEPPAAPAPEPPAPPAETPPASSTTIVIGTVTATGTNPQKIAAYDNVVQNFAKELGIKIEGKNRDALHTEIKERVGTTEAGRIFGSAGYLNAGFSVSIQKIEGKKDSESKQWSVHRLPSGMLQAYKRDEAQDSYRSTGTMKEKKPVLQWYKPDGTAGNEYYVEEGGELVRVTQDGTNYLKADGTGITVVSTVAEATRSTLIAKGKLLELASVEIAAPAASTTSGTNIWSLFGGGSSASSAGAASVPLPPGAVRFSVAPPDKQKFGTILNNNEDLLKDKGVVGYYVDGTTVQVGTYYLDGNALEFVEGEQPATRPAAISGRAIDSTNIGNVAFTKEAAERAHLKLREVDPNHLRDINDAESIGLYVDFSDDSVKSISSSGTSTITITDSTSGISSYTLQRPKSKSDPAKPTEYESVTYYVRSTHTLFSQTEAEKEAGQITLVDPSLQAGGQQTLLLQDKDALASVLNQVDTFLSVPVYASEEDRKKGVDSKWGDLEVRGNERYTRIGTLKHGTFLLTDEGRYVTYENNNPSPFETEIVQDKFSGGKQGYVTRSTGSFTRDYDSGDTNELYSTDGFGVKTGVVAKTDAGIADWEVRYIGKNKDSGQDLFEVVDYDEKGAVKKIGTCAATETPNSDCMGAVLGDGPKDAAAAAASTILTEEINEIPVLQSIYLISQSIKSYPAISHLLFGNASFYKDWQRTSDEIFAPFLGEQFFSSAICGTYRDIQPTGVAVIQVPGGMFQPVAAIQAEKSNDPAPILCSEEEPCKTKQVCWNELCYGDEDENLEPDNDEEPIMGTFYKISWGVSAPRDEKLTPFVDENGVAVSFNVWIDKDANRDNGYGIPLYTQTINLVNGQSLKDIWNTYSLHPDYKQVCIVWEKAPETRGSILRGNIPDKGFGSLEGGDGLGSEPIENVCYPITDDDSNQARVDWETLGGSSPAAQQSTTDIGGLRNTGW